MSINFKTAYSPKKRSGLNFTQKSRTKQAHKDECDINLILKRASKTGLISHVNSSKAEYGDFTAVNEYQESLNTVIQAQNAFEALPSHVRKKFGNDPGNFFEFATNPENLDEMVELGLANAPETANLPRDYTPPQDAGASADQSASDAPAS